MIARSRKFAGAKDAEALLEDLDPTLLARFRVAAAKQFVNDDALFLARDSEFAELPRHETVTELLPHRVGDQHLGAEVFVQRFEARGEVHGVADHGVIEAIGRAEISSEHLAAVNSDAGAQGLAVHYQFRKAAQITGGFRCADRMVWLIDRRAPGGEDGVADVLDDGPLVLENAFRCLSKVGGENLRYLRWDRGSRRWR